MKSLACIMVLFSIGAVQAQSPPTAAPSRASSLINAFEIMCNLELPVFEHIDAHATAMKMVLKSDTTLPSAGDTTMHNKAWIGGLTTGPFFLFDDQLSGAKGVTTACAVGGEGPDPDAFRAEAIKELKLPGEPEPEFHPRWLSILQLERLRWSGDHAHRPRPHAEQARGRDDQASLDGVEGAVQAEMMLRASSG